VKIARSTYETEPVADLPEAVVELVAAYNRLQTAMTDKPDCTVLGEGLRTVFSHSVPLSGKNGLQISPYEIGIATEAAPTGQLAVNTKKLRRALDDRADETNTLFNCEHNGLLPRSLRLVTEYKNRHTPADEGRNVFWESVYPPLIRFMNECRRTQAFWWL